MNKLKEYFNLDQESLKIYCNTCSTSTKLIDLVPEVNEKRVEGYKCINYLCPTCMEILAFITRK